jgi:CHASE2 domain
MTTSQPDSGKNPESLTRRIFVTWITSVILGTVVLFITIALERVDLIKGMEDGGQDAAMRLYAMMREDEVVPPIVVVKIDNQTRAIWDKAGTTVGQRVPDLVKFFAGGAKAVVLDLELAKGVDDKAKQRLARVFETSRVRIVAPFQELRQTHGNSEWEAWPDWIDNSAAGKTRENLVRAAALLKPDESNGLIRHLSTSACVFRRTSQSDSAKDGRWLRVPTLAGAATEKSSPEGTPCDPEGAEDERRVILFQKEHHDAGAIVAISASELIDRNDGHLLSPDSNLVGRGAIVVIGQTDAESSADEHPTPLGMMSGVLVTANEIFTVLKGPQTLGDRVLYEAALILPFAALFALIRTTIDGWAPEDPAPRQGESRPASIRWKRPIVVLAGLAVYFVAAAVFLAVVWNFMAARALSEGVVFGTFVPVLGVALEMLMEAGEVVVGLARDIARWLVDLAAPSAAKAAAGILAAALLVVTLNSGRADEAVGVLKLQNADADVTILRAGASTRPDGLAWRLLAFDTVVVGKGTTVRVERPPDDAETLRGPDTLYVGPPPRTGAAALWDAFWGHPLRAYREGITVVSRGVHDVPASDPAAILAAGGDAARALPVAGPLRLPSAFPDMGYLATDLPGLAIAWAGGTPPYDIVAENDDRATIAEFHSETTFLWRPEWRAPNAPIRLRIADTNDRRLLIQIKPSPPRQAPPGVDPLADAIDLFETEPAWRFEALRRIARLAAQDPTAARAVLAVRLSE